MNHINDVKNMTPQDKLKLMRLAGKLIMDRKKISDQKSRLAWMKSAIEYLNFKKSLQPVNEPTPSIEKDEDYLYLQSVINRKLPDMQDRSIGENLTRIVKAHAQSESYISYIKQAISAYYTAFKTMSDQFTWSKS